MVVLIFGIHPDDIELGCGGTAARCAAQGHRVVFVDVTRGESSTNGTPDQRAREAQHAAVELGCAHRESLGLPDGDIRSEDPAQERAVVSAIRRVRPDVVLVPSADDPHPDHSAGAVLIERALYRAGIAGYLTGPETHRACRPAAVFVYSGRREVTPRIVIDISEYATAKMRAIVAHRSQFGTDAASRPTPLNAAGFMESVEARDVVCGRRIGVRRAEAFDTSGPVAVDDLSMFLAKGGGG